MKSLYIKDLQKGMYINDETFAVQQIDKAETKDGKPYYKLILADKTGATKAFVWSENIANVQKGSLREGNVVVIDASVEEFKGTLQLNVFKAQKVDESVVEDFIEGSEFELDELWQKLEEHIGHVKNAKVKEFLRYLFQDQELLTKFKTSPAAEYVHHGFRGGLLEHVVEMLDLMQPLKNYYHDANFDIITAGIIFHDIGKIYELETVGVTIKRTKEGYLLGHMIKSYEILVEKSKGHLTEEQILQIKHIILSHHGQLDYGSPIVPATIEAAIVFTIDYASSKIRTYQRVMRSTKSNQGNFSEWSGVLGTKVYRSDDLTIKDEELL